jgi:hypothetical protein
VARTAAEERTRTSTSLHSRPYRLRIAAADTRDSNEKRELTFKEEGQEYAQVLKMLGNGRLEAMVRFASHKKRRRQEGRKKRDPG